MDNLASTQLALGRPPWQFHLVEQYGAGSALICRVHHGVADGVALVQVLLSLADLQPDTPCPLESSRLWPAASRADRMPR